MAAELVMILFLAILLFFYYVAVAMLYIAYGIVVALITFLQIVFRARHRQRTA